MSPDQRARAAKPQPLSTQLSFDLGIGLPSDGPSHIAVAVRPFTRQAADAVAAASGAFECDRRSTSWYAGQPIRAEVMSERIAQFRPKDIPDAQWQSIGPIVRRVAACSADTPYTATRLASIATQLLTWCDDEGVPLQDEVAFHPDTVDRFVAEACGHLRPGTRLNYQGQLRRIGEQLLGPSAYPTRRLRTGASAPVAPYSENDVVALLGWARGLPTARMRDNTNALLALGLGAGLTSQELSSLVGTDAIEDRLGLLVHVLVGPAPRAVPVLRRWEELVRNATSRTDRYPVFLPGRSRINRNDITRFVDSCPRADGPKLSVQRLRVTWIVEHLRSGTPLKALEAASGARGSQLASYLDHLPSVEPPKARRLLRDPGSR